MNVFDRLGLQTFWLVLGFYSLYSAFAKQFHIKLLDISRFYLCQQYVTYVWFKVYHLFHPRLPSAVNCEEGAKRPLALTLLSTNFLINWEISTIIISKFALFLCDRYLQIALISAKYFPNLLFSIAQTVYIF